MTTDHNKQSEGHKTGEYKPAEHDKDEKVQSKAHEERKPHAESGYKPSSERESSGHGAAHEKAPEHKPAVHESPDAQKPAGHASKPAQGSQLGKLKVIIAIIAVFFILFAGAGVSAAVYLLPPTDPVVRRITSVVPYPVMLINGQSVTYKDFLIEYDSMRHFVDETIPEDQRPTDEELTTEIIETLTNKTLVEQLFDDYNLELDQSQVDELLQVTFAQSGSEEEFFAEIESLFGWNRDQFIERVAHPIVRASQLQEAIQGDEKYNLEAKAEIEEGLRRLGEGEDFADIARDLSDDYTAQLGGDLGYVNVDELPQEWVDALNEKELNEYSDIIEMPGAYTIVMVSDKIEAAEGDDSDSEEEEASAGGEQWKIHLIAVMKKSVSEVIEQYREESSIKSFLRES